MKYIIPTLLLFLVYFSGLSQNLPTNVRWFLHHINYEGIQFDNYYNSANIWIDFEFKENLTEFSGTGACEGFWGNYNLDNNLIRITSGSVTLAGCEGPAKFFEGIYFNIILEDFFFEVSGSGPNQILKLIDEDGNYAYYKKSKPEDKQLFNKDWYLIKIETGGEEIFVPPTDAPYINLSTTEHLAIYEPLFTGNDGCNTFDGVYDMYVENKNKLSILQLNSSNSNNCTTNYHELYNSMLSNTDTNTFNFELSSQGNTLTLTNSDGDRIVYGTERIISTETFNIKNIVKVYPNPVKDFLFLEFQHKNSISPTYTVRTLNGKLISKKKTLNFNQIDLKDLNSGVYFLQLSDERNATINTIKFVKK
ncbi:META domain-containing protein [Hyunsoonleella rubra]|uniref:META domain-containing protein n=1 Tax=Hyunsoonleella rubra TaxID=1737062 RepID=A0ABW5TAK3_9FLAO